jgi:glycosyltransferase involved in cell wall biosynthesis
VDALCAALENFASNREYLLAMGLRGRERVLNCLTWEHYRQRLLQGYAQARKGKVK